MPNQYTKNKGLSLKEIKRAHGLYLCGMSLSKVAPRFNVSRGSLFNYFKRLGLPTRPLKYIGKDRPFIEYKGIKYYKDSRGQYRDSTRNRGSLIKAIWIDNHGPLEPQEVVGFVDGNTDNIALSNLYKGTRSQILLNGQRRKRENSRRKEESDNKICTL